MSARCWKRRRNKRAWYAKYASSPVVIHIGDLRAAAERCSFNDALAFWLDCPRATFRGLPA